MAIERFDIEKVVEYFEKCLKDEEEDILLEEYLLAFDEINKFFQLLGTVFGFVSSDVRAKIEILEHLRQNEENKDKFITIKIMLEFEKNSNLLYKKNYVSGSRTLLRLHRGLEFVYEFLNSLSMLQEFDETHTSCKNAYNSTLAKHHSWLIRKGAVIAMNALPKQGELLKRVCVDVPRALELLPNMLQNTKDVYDRTQNLFTIHELHELP